MSSHEREGLIARIRQMRRIAELSPGRGRSSARRPADPQAPSLEERVAHLEQMMQGLQDSVHRETTRLDERIGELEARVQPGSLARALSDDARKRGL